MKNQDVTDQKYLKFIFIFTGIVAITIVIIILKTLKAIFIPIIFSLFISFMYAPINRFLVKKFKAPLVIRLLVLGILLFLIMGIVFNLAFTSIDHFIKESPKYEGKIIDSIQQTGAYLHIPNDKINNFITNELNVFSILNNLSTNQLISNTMNNFMTVMSYVLLTIFFLVFIVSDDNRLFKKIVHLTSKNVDFTNKIIFQIEKQLIRYLVNKTMINTISAITSGIFLYLIGVDFPILSGILIFVFGFIPEIGSVVAALFPIIFCLFEFGFSIQLVLTIIMLLVINSIFGNYIEPKIMGRKFNLSPILVLCALIFWAWVWGPVGMFLAVPLTSIINIILKELNRLQSLTEIMSYVDPEDKTT